MERLVTESMADVLATRTSEKVKETFNAAWGAVISEFVNTQKSNATVTGKLEILEQTLNEQNKNILEALNLLIGEIKTTREQQHKASEILKVATKELGLSE